MVEDLMDYLKGREPDGFTPRPLYSREGDTLTYFFRNDEAYSERVDDLLTIYKSIESQELVGCKIKGVRRLIKRLENFGFAIRPERENISLNLLFLSAATERPVTVHHYYEELGRFARDIPLPSGELSGC